ncbi:MULTISPECIES: hypothetical protein [Aureimonas]|jgi:hypothetical protein|uniref:Uncharacterized protein n=1 Tax=Aureimonas flava TaxID=2320271 RepID=A0A3A1WG28_9HYPH|nr:MULTISPECIES: hypothetical protein [Aureimonas]RIX99126.1 hypothetical protein D3218_15235 [Aureimonas flava]
MRTTDDLSTVPTYRSRAIVRDLQALAVQPGLAISGRHPLKDFPALSDDLALRRFAADLRAGDWHRIADADPHDLAARLPAWREQGRDLIARDHAIATDFVAALDGDKAALDRLRAPESEGGYGEDWLARQVSSQRGRADAWRERLTDLDVFNEELGELAADAYFASREPLHDNDYDELDDYDRIRDYEDGDKPGRYYG